VTAAISALQQTAPEYGRSFEEAACSLSGLLTAQDAYERQQNLAVALQGGALRSLLLMAALDGLPVQPAITLVRLCTEAMQLLSNRDAFAEKVCHSRLKQADTALSTL
jgi:hypothetical protein